MIAREQLSVFTKRLEIQVQIVTPEGLSADPLELRMMFDFPEPEDKKQLQVFIGIGKYLSKFLPYWQVLLPFCQIYRVHAVLEEAHILMQKCLINSMTKSTVVK